MSDDKKTSKEYATTLIYRCSNCGTKVKIKSEDRDIEGFNEKYCMGAPELGKRQYIHAILTRAPSRTNIYELHECGGDSTIQWGRLELVAVKILEKVER